MRFRTARPHGGSRPGARLRRAAVILASVIALGTAVSAICPLCHITLVEANRVP